ncbi:AT-rich interactive domain-containing protein 6-like [Phragmites australis]|uniref:AT-rich interactive domain-containing protein 6-like n=1 Tax=Phragmites australis TaxID=29695 RepID=UPI002D766BD8|nr:AT-rich interactive domain-containing protein 6-like [Phragmites australis]
MLQAEVGDEPSPHAEGEAQSAADVPMDDATSAEEEKFVEGEGGSAGAAGAVDSVKGSADLEVAIPEEGDGEEQSNDAAADSVGETEKLENGSGHAKVDGKEGGGSLEEGGVDGQNQPTENQLILVPTGEDQALSKISNNSFMLDSTQGGQDSGTEEEQAAFMKELQQFYRENMMEFKPPKFYKGLSCGDNWIGWL